MAGSHLSWWNALAVRVGVDPQFIVRSRVRQPEHLVETKAPFPLNNDHYSLAFMTQISYQVQHHLFSSIPHRVAQ